MQWVHPDVPSSMNRRPDHRLIKNLFFIFSLFQMEAILPCPVTNVLVKSPSPSVIPLQKAWSLLSSRLSHPNSLSLFLWQSCSSPVLIFVSRLWIQQVPIPPQSKMQDSRWALMRAESPPSVIMFSFLKFNHKHPYFSSHFSPHTIWTAPFSQDIGGLTSRFPWTESHLSSPAIFSRHQT